MDGIKKALILGICILASAYMLSLDKIQEYSNFGNTINLESGKVRLGQVYQEEVSTSYEVTFDGDHRSSTSLQSKTQSLYSRVYDDLKDTIDRVNEQRERDKEELLSVDSAQWTKPATIKLVTTVEYESQYQNRFLLTIDETTMHYDPKAEDSKSIKQFIEELKPYSEKMMEMYERDNSFIN